MVVEGDEVLNAGHFAAAGQGGQSFWVSGTGALPPVAAATARTISVDVRDFMAGCDVTFSSLNVRTYSLG